MKLTFYLFKESVTKFEDAIRKNKLGGEDAFQELRLKRKLPFEAQAYFQQNRRTTPKWLSFLEDYFEIDLDSIHNATNAFVLLIRVEGRIFAITKGFGFTALNREKLEPNFGLRVVLNEIDTTQIRKIDARTIDTVTKQKRVLLNRNSSLVDFDFDFDAELLHFIEGKPRDETLARKISGAESLSLQIEEPLADVGNKCKILLEAFQKEDYKQRFDFIDYQHLVRNKLLINDLNNRLVTALQNRELEGLMLAYPYIEGLDRVEEFQFSYRRKKTRYAEVDLDNLYNFLDMYFPNQTIDPKKVYVVGLDNNGQAVIPRSSLYEYIVFETNFNSKRYILSLKKWYELASDYIEAIDEELGRIEEIQSPDYLPLMQKGEREDSYNKRAAKSSSKLVLLDKSNYLLDRYNRVEVSDLLSSDAEFICVKKYNGSSTLSHLFSQGSVSATLFTDDKSYREFIHKHIPSAWGTVFDVNTPDKSKITFVFAIASQKEGRLVDTLPFFSKVNLRRARKEIERLGFKVKVYKIRYGEK